MGIKMYTVDIKTTSANINQKLNLKNQDPISNLMNPLIIINRCDENGGAQKRKIFLQKKNVMKEETDEEKLNRVIFEACKKCVSKPDLQT